VQGDLFEGDLRDRHGAVDRAVDAVRGRFGSGAIRRGSLVDRPGSRANKGDDKA
jgi:hypothetical protein